MIKTVSVLHGSLDFSFDMLEFLVSDLTQQQADWMPPGKANPIGSLYWHIIAYADQIIHEWCLPPMLEISMDDWFEAKKQNQNLKMGQTPLRITGEWEEKVILSLHPENPEDPYWKVRTSREGFRADLPALHDYARATREFLQDWVLSQTPEDLERILPTPIGEYNLGDFLEIFIISHMNNHIGEISAIKGCQGLKGYPW